MSAPTKLTKKQKKGLAFRERKTTRTGRKGDASTLEDNDVPIMEDQDAIDLVEGETSVQKKQTGVGTLDGVDGGVEKKVKGKTKAPEAQKGESPEKKKRKRVDNVAGDADDDNGEKPAKRRKDEGDSEETGIGEAEVMKSKQKQRFILFVGNLKYTTSLEAIKTHFAKCDPPPTIRLLTPKVSSKGKTTTKSKGCAFLEFTHQNALQQALKLHHSTLDGRMINVELTAGGGGKSESRLAKVRARNKELLGQRAERLKKSISEGKMPANIPDRPQRFSATSGVEEAPAKSKTWTVGDIDDEKTHRGGKRHSKRSKSRPQGTGVNAIPIG